MDVRHYTLPPQRGAKLLSSYYSKKEPITLPVMTMDGQHYIPPLPRMGPKALFGCYATIRDNNGQTALHTASAGRSTGIIHFLLEKGIDHSIRDNNGQTAFHTAATKGCPLSSSRFYLEESSKKYKHIQILPEQGIDRSIPRYAFVRYSRRYLGGDGYRVYGSRP